MPTRISAQRSSCVDVILTNVSTYFKESATFETDLRDHCSVYTVLNKKLPQPEVEVVVECDISRTFIKTTSATIKVEFLSRWPSMMQMIRFQFITPKIREVTRKRNQCKRKFNKSLTIWKKISSVKK